MELKRKVTEESINALVQKYYSPERIARILGRPSLLMDFIEDAQKESVRIARETDRRLKARSRGRMGRILDITYQAIRRRPEVFVVHD